MRRLLVSALSALALGWMSGGASAQESGTVLPRTANVGQTVGQAKGGEAIPAPVQVGGHNCGQGGCYYDQACGDDHCGGDGGHIIGGFGLYLIQPYFNTNPAFAAKLTIPAGGNTIKTQQIDFTQGWDGALEAWIGYINCDGFGGRVRWFQYSQTDNFAVTVPALAGNRLDVAPANPLGIVPGAIRVFQGDQFSFSSHLGILVWDFELMQTWNPGCWQLTGSGGVRYAHLTQNYGFQTNLANPLVNEQGIASATLTSGHSFNGAGPTIALEGRRAIGGSGLAVYANGRGSILFGSDYQRAFASSVAQVGGATFNIEAYQHESNVLPVGEVEIGAEFGRDMGRGVRAMLQIGFTGQVWFGAGNASNSGGLSATTPVILPTNNINLGMAGIVFRAGLSY